MRAKYVLVIAVTLLFLTIVSLSSKMLLKTILPVIITDQFNTSGITFLLLGLSIIVSILYIKLLKIKSTNKFLIALATPVFLFAFAIIFGHLLSLPSTRLYYNIHQQDFTKLINECKKRDVIKISRLKNIKLTIVNSKDESVDSENIAMIVKKLKFVSFKKQNDDIRIIYESSMWGGYGLYFESKSTSDADKLKTTMNIRKKRISNNIYLLTLQ